MSRLKPWRSYGRGGQFLGCFTTLSDAIEQCDSAGAFGKASIRNEATGERWRRQRGQWNRTVEPTDPAAAVRGHGYCGGLR